MARTRATENRLTETIANINASSACGRQSLHLPNMVEFTDKHGDQMLRYPFRIGMIFYSSSGGRYELKRTNGQFTSGLLIGGTLRQVYDYALAYETALRENMSVNEYRMRVRARYVAEVLIGDRHVPDISIAEWVYRVLRGIEQHNIPTYVEDRLIEQKREKASDSVTVPLADIDGGEKLRLMARSWR